MTIAYSQLAIRLAAEDRTMGARRIRREQRRIDMDISRRVNSKYKDKERVRRDERMLGLLKTGTMPYTPTILSWLSVRLDKPARRITQDDVKQILKSAPAKK
jgi:hypothetical protein